MKDLYQKPELRFVEVSKQEDGETSIEVMVGDAQVGSVEMTPPGGEDGDWFVIAVYYDHVGQACEQEGFANHEEAMSVIEKWYAEWWDATWRALCGEPSKVMHPKPSLAVAGGVTMSHWTDPLRGGACADEIKDGRQYDTFAGWWGGTQHADDMLSLLAAIEYRDDRTLRLLSCRFVRETRVGDTRRTVWELLTDERSRKAVVIAELYAEGDATSEELGSAEGDAVRAAASAARAVVRRGRKKRFGVAPNYHCSNAILGGNFGRISERAIHRTRGRV